MSQSGSSKSGVSFHQIQFNNQLVDFIDKIRKLLPNDLKKTITKYYNYYKSYSNQNGKNRIDFIKEFLSYMSKYSAEISICDEGLFSEEMEYYPGKPIQIFKGIDFKLIWKLENVTQNEKTKESIWKYLQTLYLLATYVLKETEKFNSLLQEQQDIIYNILQSLKLEQKIKQDAEKLDTQEKNAQSSFDQNALKDLFGADNLITDMAIDIAKELNLSNEHLSDPMEAIKLLFGQDGSKLQEIISKVGQKLQDKVQNSGISEEHLLNDAKKMNEALVNKFKNIPGMPDIEKFTQQFAQQMSQNPSHNPNEIPNLDQLTASLTQNLQQMGLDHIDQFQNNLANLMDQINLNPPQKDSHPSTETTQSSPTHFVADDSKQQIVVNNTITNITNDIDPQTNP